jgi:hypothetical protein
MWVSTSALSLLAKSLDALDGNALDEPAMGEWAASQIAEIGKGQLPDEERQKYRAHVKGQIEAAQAAYAKGEKFFTPKAFVPAKPATTPLTDAKAKLAKQLEEVAGAGESAEKPDDAEGTETPAVETFEATTKARPARKAAPEHIGKDFVEADETDPWPDAIGGDMADLAIGPGGKVYTRVR